MKDIYILEGARTPFGTFGGMLKDVDPTDLAVTASMEAFKRSSVNPEEVDLTVMGNVIHSAKNAPYLTRHVALKSGIPVEKPALTVNRLCGSGLQSVVSAAQSLMLGEANVALAGGVESMSLAPYALRGTRFGTKLSAPQVDDMLWASLTDEYIGSGMGVTAENLADKYKISREEQDEYAALSHQRAAKARDDGKFMEEIVPVEITSRKGTTKLDTDEHIRDDTTTEKLAKLKSAFKKEGTVTGGNASGINDGAGALIIATGDYVSNKKHKPLAKIISWGIAGVDPSIMGIGPVPAIQQALKRANLTIEDMDLIEVNEAFASQYLAVEKELELDRSKVNVNGGAIALGHPIGASGTRVLYSLCKELKRRDLTYGVASLCIGGGQGIAMVVQVN
ncbi:thiolase family protein [Virgibacillus halodenitrificans]|jgi:acetyl-CoA acyltransferase 2|uniref:acetyl-CoA C-acetyltransferase n=1 Tax=Virgibacillus halodenitrificans TaxID=1482 RepID=A0AAC9J1A6_VIRHA|nr:acetyl-CoA C-acetyltransferase [Virgibacillus halodenitrificans]APC49095.1 beta-ketoadipyl CoA thiolase [Virgibacillus halodenitrificans]MCG1026891.1 acetyl-CoA C-acetyltransferase [Virgibacillus halodenitrificans]CDQ30787.1 Acetyl-CoA acetyltransferase [Virgibacillus halodenitrificans]